MDGTRAWNSYGNALVVTCTWQSFYVNKERFYCVSNVKTKGCVRYSKKNMDISRVWNSQFASYSPVHDCCRWGRPPASFSSGVEKILQLGCFHGGAAALLHSFLLVWNVAEMLHIGSLTRRVYLNYLTISRVFGPHSKSEYQDTVLMWELLSRSYFKNKGIYSQICSFFTSEWCTCLTIQYLEQ